MCVDVLSSCMPVCLVHEGSLEAGRGIGSLGVELQMTMKYQLRGYYSVDKACAEQE